MIFAAIMLLIAHSGWAYDFSAVYNGNTLYYNYINLRGDVEVVGVSGYPGDLSIPDSVTYNGNTCSVIRIGDRAFEGCYGFTSVTIPNSVTSIGSNAFYNCTGLTRTYYYGTITQWCNIDFGNEYSNPIYYSSYLIYWDSSSSTGWAGLSGNLVIPNTTNTIKNYAFINATSITSVTIPNSISRIGYYAFSGCTSLTQTNYTGTIAQWCNIDFSSRANPVLYSHNLYINNQLITNLVIPNTVDTIKQYAFEGDTCLTSVTIGNSVTSIGRTAFSGCSGLTDITFKSYNPPSFGSNSFNGVRQTVNIFVPCGRTAVYLSATNSILPPNITEMPSFTFSATSSNIQHGNVQILTQPNCTNPQAVIYATPNSGYTFRRWSDGNTDNPRTLLVTQDTALVAYFSSGQGITETESGELILYPNPASEMVTITGISNEVNILVINAMGKVVRRLDNVGDTVTFSIRDLPKGIYFVRMGNAVRKLVVE